MTVTKYWRHGRPWSADTPWRESPEAPKTAPILQLQLGDLGPEPGTVYRNRHTGERAVVLGVGQRRYCWVVMRYRGEQVEVRLDRFEDDWTPAVPARVGERPIA